MRTLRRGSLLGIGGAATAILATVVIAGPVHLSVGRFVLGIAVVLLILWVLLQAATD